jgi:D-alanine-D-alanine ligase
LHFNGKGYAVDILLIAGGWSSEREVSLNGARIVGKTLAELGHSVRMFDPQTAFGDLVQTAGQADFAFICLHGAPGEDGLLQSMLDAVGCPYQGSGPAGSFLAMHKAAAKILLRANGLPTPDWVLLTKRPPSGWRPPFPCPVFMKCNTGGSSLMLERVETPDGLEASLDRLFGFGGEYLVEPEIAGIEVTCGALDRLDGGTEALPPIMILPRASQGTFFDYASKYQAGGAEELCPAPIPQAAYQTVQKSALAAHAVLGLSGYSRTDFILREDGKAYILEVNTLPGMTATSLFPQAAAVHGLSFAQLLQRLIDLGLAERAAKIP